VDDKKQMRQIRQGVWSGSNDAMMAFQAEEQRPIRIAKPQLGTRNNEPEPITVQLRVRRFIDRRTAEERCQTERKCKESRGRARRRYSE
jgi:hypothetical protein